MSRKLLNKSQGLTYVLFILQKKSLSYILQKKLYVLQKSQELTCVLYILQKCITKMSKVKDSLMYYVYYDITHILLQFFTHITNSLMYYCNRKWKCSIFRKE